MEGDRNAPATKQDLEDLKAELKAELNQYGEDLKNGLMEFMRNIETAMLTAFHSYARAQTARLHAIDTSEHALNLRMGALEERVLALETRQPPPKQQ